MKKAGKFFSYVLVLTLIVSLMSGLGFKAEKVDAATTTYTVLEIVPDKSMGTFGLLVGDYNTPVDFDDVKINDGVEFLRQKNAGGTENWSAAASFLSTHNIGTVDTTNKKYISNDYFRQNILKSINADAVNWTINVLTKTPDQVTTDVLKSADFIVINQTVPSEFGGVNRTTFDAEGSFTNREATVMNIFKKIAGLLDGKPVPYIIDFSLYNLKNDSIDPVSYPFGAPKRTRGFVTATGVDVLRKGSDGASRFDPNGNHVYHGSDRNSYKLLKLLTAVDPATFYGLFFKGTDGSFGFDENLNQIFLYGTEGENTATYNLNGKSQEWQELAIAPWYLNNSDKDIIAKTGSDHNNHSIMDKMGWFWAGDYTYEDDKGYYKEPGDICEVIGSGAGNGVVYNSANGIFYVFDQLVPTSTTTSEPASADDLSASYSFTYSDADDDDYSGTGTLTVTNNSDKDISLKKITLGSVSGFTNIDISGGTTSYNDSTGVLKYTLKNAVVIPAGESKIFTGTWESDTSKNITSEVVVGKVEGSYEFHTDWSGTTDGQGTITLTYTGTDDIEIDSFTFTNVENVSSVSAHYGTMDFDETTKILVLIIPDDAKKFTSSNNTKSFGAASVLTTKGATSSGSAELEFKKLVKTRTDASKNALTGTATVTGVKATYSTSTVDGDKSLKKLLTPFVGNTKKVDYHPYRYLVVTKNRVDSKVNRSVIADMVSIANDEGVGLAGGIVVDCMSVEEFANISVDLSETYDGICIEGGSSSLVSGSAGAAKYSSYPSSRKISFSKSALISRFSDDLGETIGLRFITEPKEYVSNYQTHFGKENSSKDGWDMYSTTGEADLNDNTTYIDSSNKKLSFSFVVSGKSSSYDVKLYVDVDNNDKYDSYESVYKSGDKWKMGAGHQIGTASSSNNYTFSADVNLGDILGEDFAGGFSWKIVVSGGGESVSRIGFSAIKIVNDSQKTIRILQIYPTEYGKDYSKPGSDSSETASANPYSQPLILLPTKNEISAAKTNNSGNSISSYNPATQLLGIKKYFDGVLSDIVVPEGSYSQTTKKTRDNNAEYTDGTLKDISVYYMNASGLTPQTISYDGNDRDGILINSAFLYYYLEKLNTYQLDVTRYSVAEFNTKFKNEVIYNESTNKFQMKEKKADGKDDVFDLLVLGFGTSMDYMEVSAVDAIEQYIRRGGSTFAGSGTVTRTKNNTLGHRIYDELGMTTVKTSDYRLKDTLADASTMMVTNNTLFTHYPYTINHYLKAEGQSMEAYMLDVSKEDVVCTYTKYNEGSTANLYGKWGYVRQNYYLYKYRSVTYCAFGKNWKASEISQEGGVMTPAEAQIIVNALITAARNGSNSTSDDPYINCKDPDRSVLEEERPDFLPDGTVDPHSTKIWKLQDSVYTDYDSLGMAQKVISGSITFELESTTEGIIQNTSTDTAYRSIPYEYESTIEGGAKLIFATDPAGTNKLTEIKLNNTSGSEFTMDAAGTYTIGVPLNKTSYSATDMGFDLTSTKSNDQFSFYLLLKRESDNKIVEQHRIVMVRRVLYPVN